MFYEIAAITGNPGLIVGALLIGAMLQAKGMFATAVEWMMAVNACGLMMVVK